MLLFFTFLCLITLSAIVADVGHTIGIDPTAVIHVAGISSDGGITVGGNLNVKNDFESTWIQYVEARFAKAIRFTSCIHVLPRLVCDSRTGAGANFSYRAPIDFRRPDCRCATTAACFGDFHC